MSFRSEKKLQDERVYVTETQLDLLYNVERTNMKVARKFADALLHSNYVSRKFPEFRSVEVEYVPGKRADAEGRPIDNGDGTYGIQIKLPSWGKEPITIIHEFAHGLVLDQKAEEHGPEFLVHFISLLYEFMPWMLDEYIDLAIKNQVRFK